MLAVGPSSPRKTPWMTALMLSFSVCLQDAGQAVPCLTLYLHVV